VSSVRKRLIRPLQVSRRSVQILFVILTLLTPVLARYANYISARQLDKVIERMDDSAQGQTLRLTDRAIRATAAPDIPRGEGMARDRDAALAAARSLKGSTWSFELFGVNLTDPLAVLESALASRTATWVLISGVLIPIALALLFGRVFCSWMCPVGLGLEVTGKLRRVLRFLELKPGRARLWYGNKYLLLGIGLAVTFLFGMPFLGYLYPPAMLGREAHNGITVFFDRAEEGFMGFTAAGLTVASWLLLAIALAEIAFSARFWCRSLCPGAAVYNLLGAARLVRVKLEDEKCTKCGECIVVCEMGLNPMQDKLGIECDNCGECISHCPDKALGFHLPRWKPTPAAEPPETEAVS
jgi:polyferredoxin